MHVSNDAKMEFVETIQQIDLPNNLPNNPQNAAETPHGQIDR